MTQTFQDLDSALILNRVPEIGPARFAALVRHFGSPAAALSAPEEALRGVEGISSAAARNVSQSSDQRDWAAREIQRSREHGVQILHWDHPAYPPLLKLLSDAPPILYCKGNLAILRAPSIAIVGSRRATPYGEKVTRQLSAGLAELGIATISGLARGIDTFVHQATLDSKGSTIAVLGSGLLQVYPPENRNLAEILFKEGVIISEFPLDEAPLAGHFPRRNRIVSGLALGTLVVEADEKSGALITARYAAEQGREVFAVPGPITSAVSRGPNRLIKEGAKPVHSVQDILEEIQQFRGRFSDTLHAAHKEIQNEKPRSPLNREESAVLNALCSDPVHIDRLHQQLKFSTGAFSKVLLDLELKGMIKTLPGKWYVRI